MAIALTERKTRVKFGHRFAMLHLLILTVVLAGLLPARASATCTFNAGFSVQNMALTVPNVSIPRDATVGTVLATVSVPAVVGTFARCSSPGNAYYHYKGGTPAAAPSNTVATNIPGIGLRFFYQNSYGRSFRFSPAGSGAYGAYAGPWGWHSRGTAYFGVQVVVIGPAGGGQVNGGVSATIALDDLLVSSITVSPFTASVMSCVTPDVSVDLGSHRLSEMPSAGSSTSATRFSISVNNCPAGINSIQYQLDAATSIVPGTGNSVVTLTPDSTATGIGVQLLDDNGNPLALGKPVRRSGSISSSGGSYTIPLKARYYRIGSAAGGGSANTATIFQMTYR